MGRDKGLVELAGRPLVGHVIDRLGPLADEVIITTNQPGDYAAFGLRTVGDAQPGAGALDGLLTAIEAAQGDSVLVAACDMPFASKALASHLLSLSEGAEAVVPRPGGEYEPLFAVYRRTCVEPIRHALAAGQRRVISFFSEVNLRAVEADEIAGVDPGPWIFFNVNTPDDLAEAERHWRASGAKETA